MLSLKAKPLGFFLVMVLLAACSALALAALSGWGRNLLAPRLSAQVVLSDFPLPQGFGVEPQMVSDFLVSEMQKRAVADVALRITLGNDGRQKLHDVVIPRLVSAGVIRNMIVDVQPLADVLAVSRFKSVARIVVSNGGNEPLGDVAITVPGALRAENAAGEPETILFRDEDTPAISLGALPAGDEKTLTVWLDRPADFSVEARSRFRLGAAGLQNGPVFLHGAQDWPGADLEVLPWARWLVAALLVTMGVGALLALVVALASILFRKKSDIPVSRLTNQEPLNPV